MRYWFDTEFIDNGNADPIYLVSIGMVAEDGRELYLQSYDFDPEKADDWMRQNVFPHLEHPRYSRSEGQIRELLRAFCDPEKYGKPEFWAYYADYDWVVFCHLFGRMIDLPQGYPKYCLDVKQWCVSLGNPKLPAQTSTEHHALADARWTKQAWDFLCQYESKGV
jgi:hypothetical protein